MDITISHIEGQFKLSFPPLSGPAPRVLILGSMPGEESLKQVQYYGHPRNYFWPVMFSLLGKPFSPKYEDKVCLIQEQPVALWDVLAGCIRKGSLDADIKNAELNNFEPFFAANPQLRAICFNGKTAYRLFVKSVKVPAGVVLLPMPSTSPAYQQITAAERLAEWSKMLQYLDN
ncbi:MAG: DNA-deoxyinosine glycosylase [Bacteroidota bacterium]